MSKDRINRRSQLTVHDCFCELWKEPLSSIARAFVGQLHTFSMEQTFVRQVFCQPLSLAASVHFPEYKIFKNPSNSTYIISLHATLFYLMRNYTTKWLQINYPEADRTQGMAMGLLSNLHLTWIQAKAPRSTALSMEMSTTIRSISHY